LFKAELLRNSRKNFSLKGVFMSKSIKTKVLTLVVGASLFATQASAALTAPTFNADDAITVGSSVLIGLALIWGIKKAMRMAN
jgi:hypothetical protein